MMDSGSKSIRAGLNLLNSTSTSTFHHQTTSVQQAPAPQQQLASTAANTNNINTTNTGSSSRVPAAPTTATTQYQYHHHPPLLHHNSIGLVGTGGTGAASKAATLVKQSSTIGLRMNPKSPMRLNAMRERERRHLDSLNYWKREFAPLPVGADGHGACKKAACNAIDAYVPPKTRSASRNKVMPAPFPTSTIVVTHGSGNGQQQPPPVPITNTVISGKAVGGGGGGAGVPDAVSRRYAEFAKKLSPIQNSPQFFNHQLALENQPRALSPLKSPPTARAAHNQTLLGYHHHPMDLRSHRHNYSHHKSTVYAMTATAHNHHQMLPPTSYHHPVGGTGSVAAHCGAGAEPIGCHQAAMVGAVGQWNAMGAHHTHYNGYYHQQQVMSRGYGCGVAAAEDAGYEEGCENAHPVQDLVAAAQVDATAVKSAVDEDEELIFAIEI